MSGTVDLDLSGIGIRLSGLSPETAGRVRAKWGPYLGQVGGGDPELALGVRIEARRIDPAPFRPKLMRATFDGPTARFEMPEGRAEVDAGGAGDVVLAEGLGSREYYTLANLLRACLAWRMPRRSGALLHAAGLLVDGRAFALVGSEGSGKSTWAGLGETAGATVLSDDVVLLDGAGGAIEAVGAPFRSTYAGPYPQGRWPLSAILFPVHGTPASIVPCTDMLARARIIANLPFVADALEHDAGVSGVVDRLATSIPCRELTFGLEPSFVDLLREAG